jgi:hypothetical protein
MACVQELASEANQSGYLSTNEARENFPSYEDWILKESKRR